MRKTISMLLLFLVLFGSVSCALATEGELPDHLQMLVKDRHIQGWSYHNENGFEEIRCTPKEFVEQLRDLLKTQDEEQRRKGMQSTLASYGFTDEYQPALYPMNLAPKLVEYGKVSAPWGEARLCVVQLQSDISVYFIFIQKESGWYLTDYLSLDNWEFDPIHPDLPLLQHWAGKPGAWFFTRSVAHGTGAYIDFHQWYNVFTRQYDITYTMEGFDSDLWEDGWYYAGWKTELGFTREEISDVIRYITYEGLIKDPFDEPDPLGQELHSAMTLHEFRYDETTASYVRTRQETLPIMNPGSIYASAYLRLRE